MTNGRPRLIRINEVCEITSFSERTVWRYVADGRFPAPIRPTCRSSLWLEHEVVGWINDQAEARPQSRAA